MKLDVNYPDNPKMIAASGIDPMAEVLYVRGLCLAKRMVKDGVIDPTQLSRMGLHDVDHLAEILVKTELWRRIKKGYKIVGWLERNPSAKQIEEMSKKKAESGRAGGRASGRARGAQDNDSQEPF